MQYTIGIIGGLATSFVAWWVLWRFLAPRGDFSEKICLPAAGSADEYRVKFRNRSLRPMMEAQFHALLFLPTDDPQRQSHPLVSVPMLEGSYSMIGGRRGRGNRGFFFVPHRTLVLKPSLIPTAQLDRLPESLRTQLRERRPDAFAVLLRSPGAALHICCIASDAWTGARRALVSRPYTSDAFVTGSFAPGPSLAVRPTEG